MSPPSPFEPTSFCMDLVAAATTPRTLPHGEEEQARAWLHVSFRTKFNLLSGVNGVRDPKRLARSE
eukprot:2055800-Pyramimonas_sp.AAC.1